MFGKGFLKNGSLVEKCLTALIICFIFIGCHSTPDTPDTPESQTKSTGNVANVSLETKDFITMGIIYVTSTAKFDDDGKKMISGSKITYEMLIKEAQKLGAEDIVNLRIDEYSTEDKDDDDITIVTYKATALAIKYVPSTRK